MAVYLGLSCYDGFSAAHFASLGADGWVLGDPFCNFRMFPHGDSQLDDALRAVLQAGKEAVYQTPMYVTDRTFGAVTRRLGYFYAVHGVRTFLVQDVGLAVWARENLPHARMIWSRLGRSRNSVMNRDLPEFLRQLGMSGMESDLPGRIYRISQLGLSAWAVYGGLTYNTLSRDCYSRYLLDRFDGCCSRECRTEEMFLVKDAFRMRVDGHLLGAGLTYRDDPDFRQAVRTCAANVAVYAENFQDAEGRLEALKAHIEVIG